MTTFVYDGEEVVKTGREAFRNVPTPRGNKQLRVVEISPASDIGLWKKWVSPEELYQVVESENKNEGR